MTTNDTGKAMSLPSWAEFWMAKGDNEAAHDFHAFQLAEQYAIAAVEAQLATRVKVTDEDVERACHTVFPMTWGLVTDDGGHPRRANMRAALESFAASLPVANAQGHGGVREGFSALYRAASKGFHTSESCGPDNKYWRVSKFQSLQDLQSFDDAWVKVMLFARDEKA